MSHSAFCVFCCIVILLQHVRVKNGAGSIIVFITIEQPKLIRNIRV